MSLTPISFLKQKLGKHLFEGIKLYLYEDVCLTLAI